MRKLSFKYRVFFFCLLVSLVPLLICSVLLLSLLQSGLQTQNRENAGHRISEMNRNLEEAFRTCAETSLRIAQDRYLPNSLLDSVQQQSDVYLALYRAGSGLPGNAVLSLYDSGGKIRFTTDSTIAYASLPTRWGALHKAKQAAGMVYYDIENFMGKRPVFALHTVQALHNHEGALIGYAVISLPAELFQSLFSGLRDERSEVLLFNATGNMVYASRSNVSDGEAAMVKAWLHNGGTPLLESVDGEYYHVPNQISGFHLVLWMPKAFSSESLRAMQTVSLFAAVVSFLLSMMASLLISRSLSRPINRLSDAMFKVKHGQLDTRVEEDRQDELGQLTESFNKMAEDLQRYMERAIRHQQEQNESRIRLLQAQLNPHFLYNTLDTLKWLAKINKVPEIASISSNLAIILRECLSSEQFIRLRQERDMLQSYVDIQRIRFSGRFQYEAHIPEALENCVIPRLIVQPLVENSIIHGLRDQESGYVYIAATESGGDLLISVTDDGCGMPQELAESLVSVESSATDGHLGIYNVNFILKFNYGHTYGLQVKSIQGVGTTVTIRMPVKRSLDDV